MSVKKIITEPNKILRQISEPVEKVGKEEQKLMDDMLKQCMPQMELVWLLFKLVFPRELLLWILVKMKIKKNPGILLIL